MKFEILRKSHLKRNIIIGAVCIAIISAIVLNFTRAKYRTTQSIPLVNGTINYAPYDLKMVAMYQEEDGEYKSIDTVPTSGYSLNSKKSYCEVDDTKDNNVTMEYKNGRVSISINKKGTKCYLYFDKYVSSKDTILEHYNIILTRDDFNSTVTDNTSRTIYKSINESQYDNDGEVYYFAGNPNDNWMYFAGYYWRIIRINGDGTIRIIYNGNDTSQKSNSIKFTTFNSSSSDNAYVGYMYTINNVHGNATSSTIKEIVDEWYQKNLTNYAEYIDLNSNFCGDRTAYLNSSGTELGGGMGQRKTYYGAYIRLVTNKNPSFKCSNNADLYTTEFADYGNRSLKYPIGLITADEVIYAGEYVSFDIENDLFYLNGDSFWTMTPSQTEFVFYYSGGVFYHDFGLANANAGVRLVINLRSDLEITGAGTVSDPYKIV